MLREEGGRRVAGPHGRVAHEPAEEREVGRHAGDAGLRERLLEPVERLVARLARRDELRDHRVVGDRHLVAGLDARVDADPVGQLERLDPAGLGEERARVLRVQAHLDRVALRFARLEPERLARGDPQLLLDEVEPGDELGDRVLDLDAGVQLEEVEAPVVGEEELGGAGALVAGAPARSRRPPRPSPRAARRRARGRGSPRAPSGGGAGSSSRARPGGSPSRARRRGAGSRRAAAGRGSARGRRSRRRSRPSPRASPPRAPRRARPDGARSACRARRRPRPP